MIEAETRGIRRINLFGGPGCGKSVTAARLFGELSADGFECEHVQEYVKDWAYQGIVPTSFDQVYLLGQQMRREDILLRYRPLIITDSPILSGAVYARISRCPAWKEIVAIANRFEEKYPSLNIILDRDGVDYVRQGRYQSRVEALTIDQAINDFVHSNVPSSRIHRVRTKDFQIVLELVRTVAEGAMMT